jgi:hypothetical protein
VAILASKASDPKVDSTFGIESDAFFLNESIVGAENRVHFSARCSRVSDPESQVGENRVRTMG